MAHPHIKEAFQAVTHPLRTWYTARRIRRIEDIHLWKVVKYSTDKGKTWRQAEVERKYEEVPDLPVENLVPPYREAVHVALSDRIQWRRRKEQIVRGIVVRQEHLDNRSVIVRRTTRLPRFLTRNALYGKSAPDEE